MSGEEEARLAPAAFFRELLDDMHAGRRHALDHYQRRFPGCEAAIADAWRECHDDRDGARPRPHPTASRRSATTRSCGSSAAAVRPSCTSPETGA